MPGTSSILPTIYRELRAYYGHQDWWPTRGGGRWEIMLGAVLTQRTTWANAELALENVLRAWGAEGLSRPERVLEASDEELAALFRPAGFYSVKPRKVRSLAQFVVQEGGIETLSACAESDSGLRERLLQIWGIGPETADAILLYALGRPVFIADAYALRLASRWGLLSPKASYEQTKALFMDNLPHDPQLFNEFHALIVTHGKRLCKPRPICEACPLNSELPVGDDQRWRCPRLGV